MNNDFRVLLVAGAIDLLDEVDVVGGVVSDDIPLVIHILFQKRHQERSLKPLNFHFNHLLLLFMMIMLRFMTRFLLFLLLVSHYLR